jgi:2-oxoglutarate dehydrogenase E2 component (dihydrolipoamide succinyltransferase)
VLQKNEQAAVYTGIGGLNRMELRLTALSAGMEYGTVIGWRKQEGDPVEAGEAILELEADKVNYEIESPVTGTLSTIVAIQGDEIAVGEILAIIDQAAASEQEEAERG